MTGRTFDAARASLRSWLRSLLAKRNQTPYRRTRRLFLEELEDRVTPSTVSWTGGGDGVSWSDARNWTNPGDPGKLPGSSDDVLINKSGVGKINIGTGAFAVHSLNDTTAALSIASGGSLSLAAVAATSTFGQNVTVQSGASLSVGAGASILFSPWETLTDNGSLSFSSDTVTLGPGTVIAIGNRGLLSASGTSFGGNAGQIIANSGGHFIASNSTFILHAARNETSSNSWKLSVISDANVSACAVGTRSNTS
jgi:hypothetical protein